MRVEGNITCAVWLTLKLVATSGCMEISTPHATASRIDNQLNAYGSATLQQEQDQQQQQRPGLLHLSCTLDRAGAAVALKLLVLLP